MNIFYSWQSDLPSKYNRNFIKDCLERAIKKINKDLILSEAARLDQDTKGVAGTPDIANTIFAKIKESDVFVSDISFIVGDESKKLCSNPNVLIELGFALCSLTDSCVINIMNTAYGKPEGNLPFDLNHKRWPIQYELNESNSSEKSNIRKELVNKLYDAIIPILINRSAEKKGVIISVSNILNIGEVGKKILSYGLNQVLILSEIREMNSPLIKISVTRINKDGKKDIHFGNVGKVVLDFGNSENSQVGQILSDSDGNIYVIGHSVSDDRFKIVLCKILSSGHYDTSFGTNGVSTITLGSGHEYANSAVQHIDGSIISIGHQYDTKKLIAVKFFENGQLDTAFGEDGFFSLSVTNDHDWGVDLKIVAPENKILLLFNSGTYQSSIVRLNYNGRIDKNFGTNGIAVLHRFLSKADMMKATSIAVQNDGKLLVAGYGNQGIVVRLTSDGNLDKDFAQSGKKIIHGKFRTDLNKIIVRNDGGIFVAGGQSDGNSIMTGLIASLDKDGSLDTSFGDGGFLFLKGDTKRKVTDMILINESTLAIIGEENVMSNGYETTFFEILNIG